MASSGAHDNATRAALLALACAAALLAAAPAAADNGPHIDGAGSVADTCAACHRAHTSEASKLLAEPQAALCYTCHGAAGAGSNLDVVDGIGYPESGRGGTPEALRGGGFQYALIGSGEASGQREEPPNPDGVVPVLETAAATTSTHAAGPSEETAWGNGPISAEVDYGTSIRLRCGSCHDPHGNGNYRTLRAIPKESAAESPGVAIQDAETKAYTTTNYWQVEDPEAPGFIAKVSEWCSTCHTRYLSETSYTDSGDAVFTQRHRTDGTAQGGTSCAQCHVAHGSNAAVVESQGGVHSLEGVPAAAGSYLLRVDGREVCAMCHAE